MRIVNWNIERKKPASWQASSLLSEIVSLEPDLICLTEAHSDSAKGLTGHAIHVAGANWFNEKPSECKVLLWSRSHWSDIQPISPLNELGGGLAAVTMIGSRQVRCIGICAPHHMANAAGKGRRSSPWTDQIAFWERLSLILKRPSHHQIPSLVVGDFNQFVPRTWGSRRASEAMLGALGNYSILTRGICGLDGKPTVCHVAALGAGSSVSVSVRSRLDERGKARTDHDGIVAEVG